jgi:hypothetical protein
MFLQEDSVAAAGIVTDGNRALFGRMPDRARPPETSGLLLQCEVCFSIYPLPRASGRENVRQPFSSLSPISERIMLAAYGCDASGRSSHPT